MRRAMIRNNIRALESTNLSNNIYITSERDVQSSTQGFTLFSTEVQPNTNSRPKFSRIIRRALDLKNVQLNNIHGISPALIAYLESFNIEFKPSKILSGITLSAEEEEKIQEFLDPVTYEIIDIPVMLYETIYNLPTVLKILNQNSLEPLTKYRFTSRDIQPARKFNNALYDFVTQIQHNHETQEEFKDNSSESGLKV